MRFFKATLSVLILGISIYILVPTVEEAFIHPALGLFFSNALNLPLVYGVILSIIIYRTIGGIFLFAALIIGGKPIYNLLKKTLRNKTNKLLSSMN